MFCRNDIKKYGVIKMCIGVEMFYEHMETIIEAFENMRVEEIKVKLLNDNWVHITKDKKGNNIINPTLEDLGINSFRKSKEKSQTQLLLMLNGNLHLILDKRN